MNTFSVWLLNELHVRDWSSSDLARKAGISTGALSNILNGYRKPGPEVLNKIAKALEERPEHVFRQAGLLPPAPEYPDPEDDLTLAEIIAISKRLNATERRRLLNVARLHLREQREQYLADNQAGENQDSRPAPDLNKPNPATI